MSPTTEERLSSQLRNWYLAGLRKKAFAATHELTPFTLIEADRQFIETLIASSAKAETSESDSQPARRLKSANQPGYWLYFLVFWIGLLLCIGIVLAVQSADSVETAASLIQTIFLTLCFQRSSNEAWSAPSLKTLFVGVFFLCPLLGAAMRPVVLRMRTQTLCLGLAMLSMAPVALGIIALREAALGGLVQEKFVTLLAGVLGWQCIFSTIILFLLQSTVLDPIFGAMNRLQLSGGIGNLPDAIASLQRERLELQNRERAIVDAAEEMICCLSGDFRFISVSMASEKILGYLPSELTGRNVAELSLADESEKLLLFLRRVKNSQEGTTFESRMLTKFAKPVDLRWEADWSESESCYFACARNITDIKNLERAKREFVAMIGHDIRVPVGSVLLGIQSVGQGIFGEIPQAASKTLMRLENSLARLIALINELLDFEKAAAGKMSVALQKVDLSEILSAVIVDTTDFSAKKSIKLEFSPRPVTIMGDAQKLHRVFLNLISNAIKFSNNDSSVEVTVSAEPEFVEVRVTDHGCGMSADNQRLVFERYERLDAEKSAVEGTGLGLAIAKAIVEAHDGMIGVESSPGNGSTFWVTLPIARVQV